MAIPWGELSGRWPVGRLAGMENQMRVGVLLPTGKAQWGAGTDPRRLIGFGVRAEELGFDSVWAGDTLLRPVADPLTTLSAIAARTERVGLGTAVLLPALRGAVQTARELATVDLLSGGRLTVTVGAGFPGRSEREYALGGVPWAGRFGRLDDTVALWKHLWSEERPTAFHGKVLRLDDIPAGLAPYRPGGPPIWLGGFTPRALERTGRLYDGWLPYPPDPADYAPGLAAVRAASLAAGREERAVSPGVFVTVLLTDGAADARQALEAYCRASYQLPLEVVETIQALVAGTEEQVLAGLRRYLDAGASHLLVRIAGLDLQAQADQLERIAALLPHLRG